MVKTQRYRTLIPLLKVGVAGLLLGGLGLYLDPVRLWEKLQQLEAGALWMALAFSALGVVVQWVKWQRLLLSCRPQTPWRTGLHSLLIGFALGFWSPGRVGELGRGMLLGGEQTTWVGLAVVDRICSATTCVLWGWVGLALLYPAGAGAVLGVLVLGAGLGALSWSRLKARVVQWQWIGQVGAVVGQTPGTLWLQVYIWSLLFNLVFFAQFYLLLASWGPLPLEAVWGIPLFFGIKVLLPFSIMDLGVREGVAVAVFSRLQLDPAVAFNAAFLQFVFNVLVPGLVGLLLLYRHVDQRLGRGEFLKGLSTLSLEMRR